VRLPDLPREPQHIVCQLSARFQLSPAAVLAVAGAAIGTSAVLETALFPAPISPSLACALFDEEADRMEWAVEAITQPLRDEQDKNLRRLGDVGAKELVNQIQKVARDREAFFGSARVRIPSDEAGFNVKIAALRNLLHPTIIVENGSPGSLYIATLSSGGAGMLALYTDSTFATLLGTNKKGPADLELLARALQGKSPVNNFLRQSGKGPVVRPAMSCVVVARPRTIAGLLCSADPAVREFADQLIVTRPLQWHIQPSITFAAQREVPDSWSALIARLLGLRHTGRQRRMTLSPGAATLLEDYVREVGQLPPGHGRLLRHAPLLAARTALILELCPADPGREISTRTMRHAIALSKDFVRESAAASSQCTQEQEMNVLDGKAAGMLEKIKVREPVSWRKLRRTYDQQDKATLEPVLEQLLRTGQVRRREDGLLETVHPGEESAG